MLNDSTILHLSHIHDSHLTFLDAMCIRVVLCLTIVFSWIFANFGFMSLLVQFQIPITKKIKTKNDKLV